MRATVAMQLAILTTMVACFACAAKAELATGNKAPEIKATDWLNTKPLTLAALRGKVVVLEFWATWCGPCRRTIPHLIDLYKKYRDKGVVFISLTREGRARVAGFAKQMGMIYPLALGSTSLRDYGVRGIPHAFIVDANGIIRWHGHPADPRFEAAIKDTLKKTPPTVVDASQLEKMLSDAEAAEKTGNWAKALQLYRKVLQSARKDSPQAKNAKQAQDKLIKQTLTGLLGQIDEQIKSRKYVEAHDRLKEMLTQFAGTGALEQIKKKLDELLADPAASKALELARQEKRANTFLRQGQILWKAKCFASAYEKYQQAAKFSETPSGKQAAKRLAEIEKDYKLLASIKRQLADRKCSGYISAAELYIRMRRFDKARQLLQKIVDEYPQSSYAEQARQKLNSLPQSE